MSNLPAFDEATAITAARADSTGQHAAPEPPQLASTRFGRIHADVRGFGHALLHMAPVLERIAANPLIDQLVEAALQAEGLGVEAQAFHAAIDALTGASMRKAVADAGGPLPPQGSGPQPQFLPAPAQDGA
jgi:hypothetical protein